MGITSYQVGVIRSVADITQRFCYLGKPVDKCESVDYVPSVFRYNQKRHESEARSREQRRDRVDRRRQTVETAEAEKESERQKSVRKRVRRQL